MKGIKQIKNYTLIREICKGNTGTLFEAISGDKIYAIKSISTSKLDNKQVIMETFKKQLEIIRNINHKNILKIYGLEKTANNAYLVLEYCNGGNLFDYLNYYHQILNKPIPEIQIQFFVRQLIQGLECMERNKLFFRDIKLENILINFSKFLEGDNNKIDYSKKDIFESLLKIADLGYNRDVDGIMNSSTICGMPIIRDSAKELKYNDRIDLWSLGAITYELLTGIQPLYDIILINKKSFFNKFKVSLEILSFINGLLQLKHDKRFTWDQIVTHPFVVNNISTFTYIELEKADIINPICLKDNVNEFSNFLWVSFIAKFKSVRLDKIHNNKLEDIDYMKVINKKCLTPVPEKIKIMKRNNVIYDQKGDIGLHIDTYNQNEDFNIIERVPNMIENIKSSKENCNNNDTINYNYNNNIINNYKSKENTINKDLKVIDKITHENNLLENEIMILDKNFDDIIVNNKTISQINQENNKNKDFVPNKIKDIGVAEIEFNDKSIYTIDYYCIKNNNIRQDDIQKIFTNSEILNIDGIKENKLDEKDIKEEKFKDLLNDNFPYDVKVIILNDEDLWEIINSDENKIEIDGVHMEATIISDYFN